MFQLHDTTRRRLSVAGFLALGLLPALLIGGWCLSRHSSGCVQAEAERLSRQLGLEVKLGGLQYPRPGAVLYEQLEASDPETGRPVFRCQRLEISRETLDDTQGRQRPTFILTASQPQVESGSLGRIWQCLQRTLEGMQRPLESNLRLSAAGLTLRAQRHSQTLTEVQGSLENLSGGAHAQLHFRLAGSDTPEPARIRLVRNRQTSPPSSGFELYTGGGELPCSLLAMGLDELRPLGARCRFRGYLWANNTNTSDGWEGEVTGQLVELDLGRLVSDYFPHRLSGIGEATIQSARFRRGRLEEGNAIVVAGPGTIARSLMDSAVDRLGLVPGSAPPPDEENVPYDQIAFSATFDAQGLRLLGRCESTEPGVILSRGRQSLLGQSRQQPAPAVALVRTLVPQSALEVPASRQTDWLLRHLPVPEVMPVPGSNTLPQARVRLHDAWR